MTTPTTVASPPVSILKLELPRTERIDFQRAFPKLNEATLKKFSELTILRDKVVLSIGNATSSPNPSGELITSIEAIHNYLPLLLGVCHAAEGLSDTFTNKFRVLWTSSIGSSNVGPATSHSFDLEVVFILMLLGCLHRDVAASELASCTEESFDSKAASIARRLCTAAGVFEYIHSVQLASYDVKKTRSKNGNHPESLGETFVALQNLCLAEAQQVVVKKAVNKKSSHGVLAKLCADVFQKYKFAFELLDRLPTERSGLTVQPAFCTYLWMNANLFASCSFKYTGVEHYCKGCYGEAVGYLQASRQSLSFAPPKEKAAFVVSIWNEVSTHSQDALKIFEAYNGENRTIYYERVPNIDVTSLGEGRSLVKLLPFSKPSCSEVSISVDEDKTGCLLM